MSATLRAQRFAALLLTVLVTTVALLATTAAIAPNADAASKRKIRHAVRVATNQLGDHYSYGASGPNRFDCSGLMYFAFHKRSGIQMPRTSSDQYRSMRAIPKKKLRRGDLMFFYSGSGIYHVAMFMRWKNHKRILLHAPSTGSTVHRSRVWTGQWKAATLRPRH